MSILFRKAFTLFFVVLPWQYVNVWLFESWSMGNRFFWGERTKHVLIKGKATHARSQCQLWLPEQLCAFLQCYPDTIQIFDSWSLKKSHDTSTPTLNIIRRGKNRKTETLAPKSLPCALLPTFYPAPFSPLLYKLFCKQAAKKTWWVQNQEQLRGFGVLCLDCSIFKRKINI